MAFAAAERVRVTSEHSEHRGRYGTVKVAAADSDDGFNKVRLDGAPASGTVNLADAELGTTTIPCPVTYS